MRKHFETLCIFLVLIAFIIIGYYTYQSYSNKKDSNDNNVEINNYYNAEYLFNSGYLKNANTIENIEKDKSISISFEDNTMIIKYKDYIKKINEVPKGDNTVYYNNLYDDYYEFLIKTDSSIYYAYVNLENNKDSSFTMIDERIKEVYIPIYDKEGVFVNKNKNFVSSFILSDNNKNLKYIDYDNAYILKDDIKNKKPYFDYICAGTGLSACNNLIIYINFNNELVYNDETIKNNGKRIYVKDVFSSLEIESKKRVDINSLSMNDLIKHNYLFTNYIIDKNGIMYELRIVNKNMDIIKINDSSNKVKEYIYETKDNVSKLTILFEDETKEEIKSGNNKVLGTSTIYDKKSTTEKVMAP